ncbi:hypothetical protein JK176_09185 [Gluconobacter sp. Dm-73]|uniref:hypothetical protein n=1 Tax=Gluconobacter sp. Dm-73 TaxID=2799802 RepID=UPI001B8CAF83|nr:hypothetical protein [Gluconobacter sp. Dm-73]MBS1075055.1 hypothetical protein [Gluconobacter sp. Dm-73]
MKKISFGAFALTALVAAASPAMAAHHHGKHHDKGEHAAKASGSPTTEDLNARSLQQAQTPVSPAAPTAAIPPAAPTAIPTAPSLQAAPAASTMPAPTQGN